MHACRVRALTVGGQHSSGLRSSQQQSPGRHEEAAVRSIGGTAQHSAATESACGAPMAASLRLRKSNGRCRYNRNERGPCFIPAAAVEHGHGGSDDGGEGGGGGGDGRGVRDDAVMAWSSIQVGACLVVSSIRKWAVVFQEQAHRSLFPGALGCTHLHKRITVSEVRVNWTWQRRHMRVRVMGERESERATKACCSRSSWWARNAAFARSCRRAAARWGR